MAKKQLTDLRSGKEFVHYANNHPNTRETRQTGSHFIAKTDSGMVVIPSHSKDLGTGIRNAIIKTMLAIGLGVFLLIAIL